MSNSLKKCKSQNNGVEIILEDLKGHPSCPHGPMLLFSRKTERKNERKTFFACSACRDRKLCNFFLLKSDNSILSKKKRDIWERKLQMVRKHISHEELFLLLNKVKSLPVHKRIYCQKCCTFVVDNQDKHTDHSTVTNITDYQLEHPSEILAPLENPKKEAQYLFSKYSVKVLVDIFQDLKYKNVICIGTPRIHEYIQSECQNMTSLLLDIDDRFHSFFGPLQFCWYNLFNNHFFCEEAQMVFNDFLKSANGKDTVLVTDPPFGGRTEPLAFTFNTITTQYKRLNRKDNNLAIFWIFPYFMEPQIQNSLPDFAMLDYKVEYDNHPLFQNGPKGRKQGSPVRIFTNINSKLIKLPGDSYKYCKLCNKWVAKENRHCTFCGYCTSKNGLTYVHCNICNRCVKPTWKHFSCCDRCTQSDHKCVRIDFTGACLVCKNNGHKKTDCPYINKRHMLKRKRKTELVPAKKSKIEEV